MRRRPWISQLERRTIVCHLSDGASIRGVLLAAYRDCLVLTSSTFLGQAAGEQVVVPVDGEAVIPRERVSWIQTLPSPPALEAP
jgi:hypothetical protein